jgi:hypothetical protein
MPKIKLHALLPFIFLLAVLTVRFLSFESYRIVVREDGILETLQFIFYFLAGWILFMTVLYMMSKPKQWMLKSSLFLLSGILLFISFEEISWGERILGYQNPDFFTVYNVQQEVSLHNLVYIQPLVHLIYIVVGVSFGLVVPFLSKISQFKKYRQFLFGWDLSMYFLPLSIVYILLLISVPASLYGFNAYGLIWRDQEVVETLLAMGLFVWAVKHSLRGNLL